MIGDGGWGRFPYYWITVMTDVNTVSYAGTGPVHSHDLKELLNGFFSRILISFNNSMDLNQRTGARMTKQSSLSHAQNQVILYTAADGKVMANVFFANDTFWLTQSVMSE